eukprot:3792574-Amphidinium_carterae.1
MHSGGDTGARGSQEPAPPSIFAAKQPAAKQPATQQRATPIGAPTGAGGKGKYPLFKPAPKPPKGYPGHPSASQRAKAPQ